jgi:hypothetical protein
MKISSDFVDYYDQECSGEGRSFKRHQAGGPGRKEVFSLLYTLKYKVPVHGKISTLYDSLIKSLNKTDAEFRDDKNNHLYQVILYKDQQTHDQSSLVKKTILEALTTPDCYGAQVIPVNSGQPMTYEWYKVGHREYWVEHTSDDSYRSGVGVTKARVIGGSSMAKQLGLQDLAKVFVAPLIRLAFVPYQLTNGRKGITAVDLDTGPKLMGTPVAEELTAADCCEEIARYLHNELPDLQP